ncbi:hypothetical protein [Lactobacillus paragasseri]|uniref:Uncharacterized protein n=1 Tax=Lactobacillus paragasseri TaxID=2107999 RepID=A0ABD5A321_9LACO|nr:hypothetical protein [Lactobacillus paragasseri]MDK7953045.1 hypothetical protein [Lactobacillus paragasseri]MDO6362079.1 hypothetical protein [Lactobacillus paragasseri]MDX5060410.1 hypothetical protein [Lactobacillus paragasseri]
MKKLLLSVLVLLSLGSAVAVSAQAASAAQLNGYPLHEMKPSDGIVYSPHG